jgi:hypothetical protein
MGTKCELVWIEFNKTVCGMGEAKRKARLPCRCGSGLSAALCCLTPRGWHKRPTVLDFSKSKESGNHPGCYLRETGTCSSKLSGEHFVSEAVLRVLGDQEVEVSGFGWLQGTKKILKFANLTAKCLCTNHNSALADIDSVGGKFFTAVQKCCGIDHPPNLSFIFSGHDVERWLFRTLAALAVSHNLFVNQRKLVNKIHAEINFVELLQEISRWRRPLGMYTMQLVGQTFTYHGNFSFGPIIMRDSNEIVGLLTDIQGIHIGLLAADQEIQGTGLDRGFYRPGKLIFKLGNVTHSIQLCWEDELKHDEITFGSSG